VVTNISVTVVSFVRLTHLGADKCCITACRLIDNQAKTGVQDVDSPFIQLGVPVDCSPDGS